VVCGRAVTGPDSSVTSIGTHRYHVSCAWHGSTGAGYEAYDRSHESRAPPADATLQLSSDPVFRGTAALLNPEQLLVMAAASCQLLSFLAVAARARIDVVDYQDDAAGEMPEDEQLMRLTRITLRPRITVRGDVSVDRVRHLVEVGHRECFIANSLETDVVVEPEVVRI
jgi:organic hydroperoxide reductase OsmC/OhrA